MDGRGDDDPADDPDNDEADVDEADVDSPEVDAPGVDEAGSDAGSDEAGDKAPTGGSPDVDEPRDDVRPAPGPVEHDAEERGRPARGGLFGRRRRSGRAPEPAAPPRPRTVADLVAERAAAQRAAGPRGRVAGE